jgi:uncharacterized membrane protein required for colicin V production
MNGIDILIILVLILCIWSGWRKGFAATTLELIPWLGSLLAGFLLYKYVAIGIDKIIKNLGVWLYPLAFIITVVIFRILLYYLIKRVFRFITKETHKNIVNKILGIIPGSINGAIYSFIIVALLSSLPLFDGLSAAMQNSKIADNLTGQVEWMDEKLSPVFDEAVKKTLNKLTVEPGSTETVKLHFRVTNPKVRSDLESRMLDMVNEERKKVGLQPLNADPELTIVG